MAAPHAIHEEFPHDAEIIHKLKVSDNHFARLLDEYDSLNDEVAAAAGTISYELFCALAPRVPVSVRGAGA